MPNFHTPNVIKMYLYCKFLPCELLFFVIAKWSV